jgi:glycosyltransferase involved in cell wall biosynthesis
MSLNVEDIAKKIALLVSDTELREKLRMAGYIRQKQFSWENSANAVCNLLYAIK